MKSSKVTSLREALGWSQRQFASALGISRVHCVLVESGQRPLNNKHSKDLDQLQQLVDLTKKVEPIPPHKSLKAAEDMLILNQLKLKEKKLAQQQALLKILLNSKDMNERAAANALQQFAAVDKSDLPRRIKNYIRIYKNETENKLLAASAMRHIAIATSVAGLTAEIAYLKSLLTEKKPK